ncbi:MULTISPECIES: hypothetical protein [Anaerolinea]|uniref:hypothetical protein n=1 Tax=Anaerolinea TaxID=233189 RepID=UPI00260EE38B|nr:hypothetical protein [Anaerolinea thermophila]
MSFLETLLERYELPRLILSFVFVVAGLGMAYLLGQVHTLNCQRTQGRQHCQIAVSWMGIVPLRQETLNPLQGARVDESCDEDGCTYRVVLRTGSGDVPLGVGYSSGLKSKEDMAETIQAFVANPSQPDLKVQTGGGLWIAFPLVFFMVGLWMGISPVISSFLPSRDDTPL